MPLRHLRPPVLWCAAIASAVFAAGPALADTSAPAAAPGNFLALSDVHFTTNPASDCQSNETTASQWRAAQAQAVKVIAAEQPAFAVYVGDLPKHCSDNTNDIKSPLDGLATIAGTTLKLFYVPGNNDSLDGDYQPFTTGNGTVLSLSKPWNTMPVLNAAPGDVIDMAHLSDGYYSAYAVQAAGGAPALRMIVLNTNVYTTSYDRNVANFGAVGDAQLEWLNAQMKAVRKNGERAIIAMHVPPGTDGSRDDIRTMWNPRITYGGTDPELAQGWIQGTFLAIVANYATEIVGTLSSHTHYNEVRRLRACDAALPNLGTFAELDIAIPSITTDHGNMAAMKVMRYDGGFEWVENTTFYATDPSGERWTGDPGAPSPLSFMKTNYCASQPCPLGGTLRDRIASLDSATRINTSDALAGMMRKWVRPGASPPGQHQYRLALDATCDVPDAGNAGAPGPRRPRAARGRATS